MGLALLNANPMSVLPKTPGILGYPNMQTVTYNAQPSYYTTTGQTASPAPINYQLIPKFDNTPIVTPQRLYMGSPDKIYNGPDLTRNQYNWGQPTYSNAPVGTVPNPSPSSNYIYSGGIVRQQPTVPVKPQTIPAQYAQTVAPVRSAKTTTAPKPAKATTAPKIRK